LWSGSGPIQARFPKLVLTFFAEIGARVAKLAGGFVLGSMAKAWLRMSVAQASFWERRKLVFCATDYPHGTSDKLREAGDRGRNPWASNATARPDHLRGARRAGVHVLFYCLRVVVTYIVMGEHDSDLHGLWSFFAEIGARVAKLAGGFVLGSMAKAWLRMSVAQAS